MAGGYKMFGPTYNSTPFLRLGYEGIVNGLHEIDVAVAQGVNGELAGKIAAIGIDGVKLAGAGAAGAVGLFREDLGDMVNASLKASFYMRGGEYYVAQVRTGIADLSTVAIGDQLTTDADGKLIKLTDPATEKAVGVITLLGEFRNGNMYEWAGTPANGGEFLGFIMYI
jgi:hypothetical protein